MQPKLKRAGAQNDPVDLEPTQYEWPVLESQRENLGESRSEQTQTIAAQSSVLALLDSQAITICVLNGPSKGLAHQLTKPRTSIGQTGGGADIEIDDPHVSAMHCVVGATKDTIRLYDLDSESGTYVNDEHIQAADLEHLSEFRVGSTLLLVMILPKSKTETRD